MEDYKYKQEEEQLSIFNRDEMVIGVSEFLTMVNDNLKRYRVSIKGEVSGRVNRRGAVTYFSIHDEDDDAVLQCMGFNNILDKLGIELEEGMAVQINGYPEIWKRSGGFSFKVFSVLLTGEGALLKQFEALKRKLEAEGLFKDEYKKSLPRFVSKIGLITSEGREAQTDFLTHLSNRGLNIFLHDARMEGAQAVTQVVEAIRYLNENKPELDVIVITRGGGSMESLQAFNSEDVVRAIFASKIPIISAIGHEKDVTVADFVADVRASTPTHAGKIISTDWEEAEQGIEILKQKLEAGVVSIISNYSQYLREWEISKKNTIESIIEEMNSKLIGYSRGFNLGNPESRLKQGYSITTNEKGVIIKDVKKVKKGDNIMTKLYNGDVRSFVG